MLFHSVYLANKCKWIYTNECTHTSFHLVSLEQAVLLLLLLLKWLNIGFSRSKDFLAKGRT